MTPEKRYELEVRAEEVLTKWAFDYFEQSENRDTEGDCLCLLANVGRCIFKWRRYGEGLDGTYVALIQDTSDAAFADLSEVERRGVLAALYHLKPPITFDSIPPVFDEKMAEWVEKLEQMREKQNAA